MEKQSPRLSPAWLLGAAGVGLLAREAWRRAREINLRGQVALVTGSSRGLGFLLARDLARQGCRIILCARDAGELERARDRLTARGADVLAVPCDIGSREQVALLLDVALRRYGQIDILVNNAGEIEVGPVDCMSLADFEQAMNVMFWGTVYPTLAVLPAMREHGRGRIVNITSIGGKVSLPHMIPYSCAKFAAVAFSEGLRAELADEGIPVITVVPGLMRTGGYLNARFKGRQEGEFTWFSLSASLPGLAMNAEGAARRIVRAIRRGEAEPILSLPANLLAGFHGIFPGTTADLLGLVDRFLLPPADGRPDAARGEEVQERLHSSLLDTLTAAGRSAARRYQRLEGLNGKEVATGLPRN
jgi:short-subunit dehydrogenase